MANANCASTNEYIVLYVQITFWFNNITAQNNGLSMVINTKENKYKNHDITEGTHNIIQEFIKKTKKD